jgi:hypothetical protein
MAKSIQNMSLAKTILIIGDSWSQGELMDNKDDTGSIVVHAGTEQYLLDSGHTVINLGILGGSNTQAMQNYQKFTDHADYIFWFQTDPLRDVNGKNNDGELFIELLQRFNSIKAVFDYLIADVQNKINNIAINKNQIVHVIGGFSVLTPNINKFSNLRNFITNVSALIDPQTNFEVYGYFPEFDWFINIVEYYKKHNLVSDSVLSYITQEYIDIMSEHQHIFEYMSNNKQYYWPDNRHPNRHGHKIIFNQIEKLINEN